MRGNLAVDPTAGQLLVGQAGGTYLPRTVSGAFTIDENGVASGGGGGGGNWTNLAHDVTLSTDASVDAVGNIVLSAPQSSLVISAIPQTYNTLLIAGVGTTDDSTQESNPIMIVLNNNADSTYDAVYNENDGSSPSTGQFSQKNQEGMYIGNFSGPVAPPHNYGWFRTLILNAPDAGEEIKMLFGRYGWNTNSTQADLTLGELFGQWRAFTDSVASNITQIEIFDGDGGHMLTTCRFQLYGMN